MGNSLELKETIEVLRGGGDEALTSLCLELSAWMLFLAGQGYLEPCRAMAQKALKSGAALQKFRRLIEAQGGDPRVIEAPSLLPGASHRREIKAQKDGYFAQMDAQTAASPPQFWERAESARKTLSTMGRASGFSGK